MIGSTAGRAAAASSILVISAMPVIQGIVRAAAASIDGAPAVTNCDSSGMLTELGEQLDPIVVVDFDTSLKGSLDVLRLIRRTRPDARSIALSSRAEGAIILEVIRLGARAFVRAPDDLETLPEVLTRVARGERWLPPELERAMVSELGAYVQRTRDGTEVDQHITGRQREIVGLLAEGFTIAQISRRLAISPRTVETHIANLYRKLSVRTRLQVIARAASLGIIDLR